MREREGNARQLGGRHKKVFPIPGVNTSGYCSHLKPLSVRAKGRGGG